MHAEFADDGLHCGGVYVQGADDLRQMALPMVSYIGGAGCWLLVEDRER
jgi:hypothetical protein